MIQSKKYIVMKLMAVFISEYTNDVKFSINKVEKLSIIECKECIN